MPSVALDLQRLFVEFQGLVVIAAVVHKIAKIKQGGSDTALVADIAADLESLLKAFQGLGWFAQLRLNVGDFVQTGAIPRRWPMRPLDGQRFLEILQRLLWLV